jgi:hypothetical protein
MQLLPLPFSDRAVAEIRSLLEAREELYAPALLGVRGLLSRQAGGRPEDLRQRQGVTGSRLDQTLRIHPITPASSLHFRAQQQDGHPMA